jgi:putative lipoprotein
VLAALLAAGCAPDATPSGDSRAQQATVPAAVPPARDSRALFVYDCDEDGGPYTVRVGADSAWLLLPLRTLALPHVPAASGARYSNGTDTFWSRGDSARFEIGGQVHASCGGRAAADVWDAARISGVDFRATGNEPGWWLEITDDIRIVVAADYGEVRVVTPAPAPRLDADGARTYHVRIDRHELTIVLRDTACTDAMSGEAFPTHVTLTLDARGYTGCGRPFSAHSAPPREPPSSSAPSHPETPRSSRP